MELNTTASPIATDAGSGPLAAIADRYFAAWRERDATAIAALHTTGTRFRTHLAGEAEAHGRDEVAATFAALFERLPDFDFEVDRVLFGERHWVLDWTLLTAGRRVDCVDVVEVDGDGLVSRKDTYLDPSTAA